MSETTYKERMVSELSELDVRREKLEAFKYTDEFKQLKLTDRLLLRKQLAAMSSYSFILKQRVGNK